MGLRPQTQMVPIAVMLVANQLRRFASQGGTVLRFSPIPLLEISNFAVLWGFSRVLRWYPTAH
jgi:hypothetical protein